MIVQNMTAEECAALLGVVRLGRLACSKDGQPYVVPFHFAYADNSIYAFSVLGKKIEIMRTNPLVCVLVEKQGKGREWQSLVITGRFHELPDRSGFEWARDRAWSLLSKHAEWWEPGTLKPIDPGSGIPGPPIFYAIRVDEMTGRKAREISAV
jgi:nitroimidazol reductase NimA-like FMN-containing flavoprotein (pyridoxamine 5'-phosphate oxidase superfamily)